MRAKLKKHKRWLIGLPVAWMLAVVMLGAVVAGAAAAVLASPVGQVASGATCVANSVASFVGFGSDKISAFCKFRAELLKGLSPAQRKRLDQQFGQALRAELDCANATPEQVRNHQCIPGLLGYGENKQGAIPASAQWLIPVWQQAASKYNVPWQVLAAVNAARTEFGVVDCPSSESNQPGDGFYRMSQKAWKKYMTDAGQAHTRASSGCASSTAPASFVPDHRFNEYDAVDTTFAEAKLLAAKGAAGQSAWHYNGSPSDNCTPLSSDGQVFEPTVSASGVLISSTSGLTVQGQPISQMQLNVAKTALGVANSLHAPQVAEVAMIYAGMGESDLNPGAPGGGVWQDLSSPDPGNVANEARAWMLGQYGFRSGGGIAMARSGVSDPITIANSVEANAAWIDGHHDSYGHEWPGGAQQGIQEATKIVAALGGAAGSSAGYGTSYSDYSLKFVAFHGKGGTDPVSKAVAYFDGVYRMSNCYVARVYDWYQAIQQNPGQGQDNSALFQRIVQIAEHEAQLGLSSGPAAARYGFPTGAGWCSYFASWVWRQAGVNIPVFPNCTGFHDWAVARGLWLPASATPQPGDAVLYGTPNDCVHVGIVVQVKPDGSWVSVEGNYAGKVSIVAHPPHSAGPGNTEPAPIAGFAEPATPGSGGVGGYVNPFKGDQVTPERIDMGVDYSAPPGEPIYALGDGRVTEASNSDSGWAYCGAAGSIDYTLSDGPDAGRNVYVAEGVHVTVRPRQTVTAGQQIATFAGSGCIETGWASGTGSSVLPPPEAAVLGQANSGGDPGQNRSYCGDQFSQLLQQLGAVGGLAEGKPVVGSSCP